MDRPCITIELPLEDVNLILFVLSKRPYEEVFVLIDEIRKQATKQVNFDGTALN